MKKIFFNLLFIFFLFILVVNVEADYVCKNTLKSTCAPTGSAFWSNQDLNFTCGSNWQGTKCYSATTTEMGCNEGVCAGKNKVLVKYSGGGWTAYLCEGSCSTATPIPTPPCGYADGCFISGSVCGHLCSWGECGEDGCAWNQRYVSVGWGAACCASSSSGCEVFQGCVAPTSTPGPNDPTNTPGPGTTTCTRCSNIHGCQMGTWTNQITNPSTPCEPVIPIGSVTYINDTINCGPLDPIPSGGDNNACPTNPTLTPTPTLFTCYNKCSSNYDYTEAYEYYSTTEDCVNVVSSPPPKYRCKCDCGANSVLHLDYGCNAQCGAPTNTPTPTPTSGPTNTPIPGCVCSSSGTCATVCAFEKFSDITYISPVKCSLSPLLFASTITPSAINKNSWCQRTKRTKGDANGDGVVDDSDYYLYVGAANGGQIPATANPDFNGDGEVGASDRVIIMKILKP